MLAGKSDGFIKKVKPVSFPSRGRGLWAFLRKRETTCIDMIIWRSGARGSVMS
jgi:hypothetical protein